MRSSTHSVQTERNAGKRNGTILGRERDPWRKVREGRGRRVGGWRSRQVKSWVLGDKRRMEEGSAWSKISTDATDDVRATRLAGDRYTRPFLSWASTSMWNESKGRQMMEEEACWTIQNEDKEVSTKRTSLANEQNHASIGLREPHTQNPVKQRRCGVASDTPPRPMTRLTTVHNQQIEAPEGSISSH